jgi:hypothetical protein
MIPKTIVAQKKPIQGCSTPRKKTSSPIADEPASAPPLSRPGVDIKTGDIITTETFDNFEFSWEWRIEKDGNNGIKYFVTEARPGAPGHEYQMIDDDAPKWASLHAESKTASYYEVLPPAADRPLNPAGQWNRSRLVVRGSVVEHWLNDRKVLTYELGSPAVVAGIAKSKFKKYPDFGQKLRGHLMLTDHGDAAWFRSLKIRELPAP